MQSKTKAYTALVFFVGMVFSTFIIRPFQVLFDLNLQKAYEAKSWDTLLAACLDKGECGGDIFLLAVEKALIFLSNPYLVGFAFGALIFAFWDPVARFIKKDKRDEALEKISEQVSLSNRQVNLSNRTSYPDLKLLKEEDLELVDRRVSQTMTVVLEAGGTEIVQACSMQSNDGIFITATYVKAHQPWLDSYEAGSYSTLKMSDDLLIMNESNALGRPLPDGIRVKLDMKEKITESFWLRNPSMSRRRADLKIEGKII